MPDRLISERRKFLEARRATGNMSEPLVVDRNRPPIFRQLREKIRTRAPDSLRIRISVKRCLLECFEQFAFVLARHVLFIHEQRYCRSSIDMSEQASYRFLHATACAHVESVGGLMYLLGDLLEAISEQPLFPKLPSVFRHGFQSLPLADRVMDFLF